VYSIMKLFAMGLVEFARHSVFLPGIMSSIRNGSQGQEPD
jgi:hypothetical protein